MTEIADLIKKMTLEEKAASVLEPVHGRRRQLNAWAYRR